MSLIVLALVLWIVVVPAVVVLGALLCPRRAPRRLTGSASDEAPRASVTSLRRRDSRGFTRQSA